jgi:predicted dehydrogenase
MTTNNEQRGPESLDFSRRGFLKGGLAAGVVAGAGMGGFYFGYGKSVGSPVRVGVIGTGDEGSVLIGALNPNYLEVRSIADIRPYNVYRAFHGELGVAVRPGLLSVYGWKDESQARKHVKVYGPWEELLDSAKQDQLEGVIIALPLFLHHPVAIAAMQRGLHVITEKLMGHTVRECKEMAQVAKATGLHLATGHQRHYNILYAEAAEKIKRGVLGDLHFIRAQWHRSNLPGKDSWQQPMP